MLSLKTIPKESTARTNLPIGFGLKNSNSASAEVDSGRGIVDTFVSSEGTENLPVPTRRQVSQMVFGSPQKDVVDQLGELFTERGIGGVMQKRELQKIAPALFADVSTAPTAVTSGTPASSTDTGWSAKPADTLFYSNNPERIKETNLKLASGKLPSGTTRVMSHHLNDTKQNVELQTYFRNNGDQPVKVTIWNRGAGVNVEGYAFKTGSDAVGKAMNSKPETKVINPGQSYYLHNESLKPGQVASTLSLVETDGELEAVTAVVNPNAKAGATPLKQAKLEDSKQRRDQSGNPLPSLRGLEFRGSGVYEQPDKILSGTLDMAPGKLQHITIGESPENQGVRSDYPGDYGKSNYVGLKVPAEAKEGQRLVLLGWAGGEDPVSIRGIDDPGKLYQVFAKFDKKTGDPLNKNQVVVLFDQPVQPGQEIKFEQMIQGGGAGPLRILALPLK